MRQDDFFAISDETERADITETRWTTVLLRVVRRDIPWDAVTLLIASLVMLLGSVLKWLDEPLIHVYRGWSLPIDIGWGAHIPVFNYGLLCMLAGGGMLVRSVLAFDLSHLPLSFAPRWRPRPLRLASLVAMGMLTISISLLFAFQMLLVDFPMMSNVLDQTNDSLFIQRFLGYSMYPLLLPVSLFSLDLSSITDRFTLLVTNLDLGAIMPMVCGCVCLYAAFLNWRIVRQWRAQGRPRREPHAPTWAQQLLVLAAWAMAPMIALLFAELIPQVIMPLLATLLLALVSYSIRRLVLRRMDTTSATPPAPGGSSHVTYRRWLLPIAAMSFGLFLFARGPVGVWFHEQGKNALDAGNYQSALVWFKRAKSLLPALDALPSFHAERGEALYQLGNTNTLDSGLYLTQHDRDLGAYTQALAIDEQLAQQYPGDALINHDTVISLKLLLFSFAGSVNAQLPPDAAALVIQSQLVAYASEDQALPYLNELTQRQPDGVFAFYLRGRINFAQGAYESAEADFQQAIRLSTDREMLSTSYTYLSFCHTALGDYTGARTLLLKAVKLDDQYFNTTAREAASGLH